MPVESRSRAMKLFCIFGLITIIQPISLAQSPKSVGTINVQRPINVKAGHAYAVTYSGPCSAGPIVHKDGHLFRFAPADGSALTDITQPADFAAFRTCYMAGLAYNYADGSLYAVASGNILYKAKPDGSLAEYAKFSDSAGADFLVDEIEFDASGNLYLLKQGDTQRLYRVQAIALVPTTIIVSTIWYTLHPPATSRPITLISSPTKLWLAYQAQNIYGPVWVRQISTTTSGGMVGTPSAHKNCDGALTDNFSGYYYNGQLYLVRNETLYRMPVATPGQASILGTFGIGKPLDIAFIP